MTEGAEVSSGDDAAMVGVKPVTDGAVSSAGIGTDGEATTAGPVATAGALFVTTAGPVATIGALLETAISGYRPANAGAEVEQTDCVTVTVALSVSAAAYYS
jgi:hypothetical protein